MQGSVKREIKKKMNAQNVASQFYESTDWTRTQSLFKNCFKGAVDAFSELI